ncbi:MAG TPA: hypothetical protein DCQ98_22130 [Planctomycetaceae bacterium]|nr:hypothetical protein [Planctomycetaceae bacterium]
MLRGLFRPTVVAPTRDGLPAVAGRSRIDCRSSDEASRRTGSNVPIESVVRFVRRTATTLARPMRYQDPAGLREAQGLDA